MHIGKQIKYARMMKGLTQQQLADKVHKTRPLISSIEQTGKVNIYTLKQICEALDMDIESLSMLTGEVSEIYPKKTSEVEENLRREIDGLRQQLANCQNEMINLLKEKLSVKKTKGK